MFRRKTTIGNFVHDQNGTPLLTPSDLYQIVEEGRARMVVPMDGRLSPWLVPKLFSLSRKQALELMTAIGGASDEYCARVAWLIRSDGTITLVPREQI
jgi:hypothetical protein